MDKNQNIEKRFGAKLAYLRKSKNLSQEEIAAEVGITFQYVSQIECGLANPTLEKIIKLADVLEVEVKDLFDFSF